RDRETPVVLLEAGGLEVAVLDMHAPALRVVGEDEAVVLELRLLEVEVHLRVKAQAPRPEIEDAVDSDLVLRLVVALGGVAREPGEAHGAARPAIGTRELCRLQSLGERAVG